MTQSKTSRTKLILIGFGFSGRSLVEHIDRDIFNEVYVTTRSVSKAERLKNEGYQPLVFDGDTPSDTLQTHLADATHVIMCAPPSEKGDPFLTYHGDDLMKANHLTWLGYLSTIGVYGDHQGAWVDETTPPAPTNQRGKWRVRAEQSWQKLADYHSIPLSIFRLSGIYGPRRNVFEKLKKGKARRIIKQDQVFNRIHVSDIGRFVAKALSLNADGLYNITDSLPAPPQDVVSYAAELMGVEPPPKVSFEDADLSPMARSFYGDNKRVSNAKSIRELDLNYLYPTYQEGLQAIKSL